MMDLPEALDVVVGRTKHRRYRELCDPSHPDYAPAYVPVVLRLAAEMTGAAPPPAAARTIPLAESVELTRRANACPFRSKGPGCGCGGARCGLRGGAIVNHIDCMECVRQYGA